jgi:hypothetical protein
LVAGKTTYCVDELSEKLILRRTEEILRSFFSFRYFSRNEEVEQLANVIKSEKKVQVIKTDLSNFFESVSFADCISSLERNGFDNPSVLGYLKSLCRKIKRLGFQGLPRGLSISSILSELALIELDRGLIRDERIIHYSRFVDDIVVLSLPDAPSMVKRIETFLPKSLHLNPTKTNVFQSDSAASFDYLGYQVKLGDKPKIGVSQKKISRTKKRIILSLQSFIAKKDFSLLLDRLKFLSAGAELKLVGRSQPVISGFRFQYPIADMDLVREQMRELDSFYAGILKSNKYYLAKQLKANLSGMQYDKLRQQSFLAGYDRSFVKRFPGKRAAQVTRAWRYG